MTNTPAKFYFYPQFEKGTCAKSIQQKMERSQSLDILESPSPKGLNSAPKRIRSLVSGFSYKTIKIVYRFLITALPAV